jgi:hypothetical protein
MKRKFLPAAVMLCVFILLFTLPALAEDVTDKEITINFSFSIREGVYTGTLTDGVPDGTGTFCYQNTESLVWTYHGEFANGTFEGHGVISMADGTIKEGEYHDGQLNGYGACYKNGQPVYKGYFENDEFSGEGKYYQNGQLVEERFLRTEIFMMESIIRTVQHIR